MNDIRAPDAGEARCSGRTIPANKRLIEWISEQGKHIDAKETDDGLAFVGRVETLLTDTDAEPNQSKWESQVAIKVAD